MTNMNFESTECRTQFLFGIPYEGMSYRRLYKRVDHDLIHTILFFSFPQNPNSNWWQWITRPNSGEGQQFVCSVFIRFQLWKLVREMSIEILFFFLSPSENNINCYQLYLYKHQLNIFVWHKRTMCMCIIMKIIHCSYVYKWIYIARISCCNIMNYINIKYIKPMLCCTHSKHLLPVYK